MKVQKTMKALLLMLMAIHAANFGDTNRDKESQSEVGAGVSHPSSPESSQPQSGHSGADDGQEKGMCSGTACSEHTTGDNVLLKFPNASGDDSRWTLRRTDSKEDICFCRKKELQIVDDSYRDRITMSSCADFARGVSKVTISNVTQSDSGIFALCNSKEICSCAGLVVRPAKTEPPVVLPAKTEPPDDNNSLIIVLSVGGGVVLLAVPLAVLAVYFWRRRNRQQTSSTETDLEGTAAEREQLNSASDADGAQRTSDEQDSQNSVEQGDGMKMDTLNQHC